MTKPLKNQDPKRKQNIDSYWERQSWFYRKPRKSLCLKCLKINVNEECCKENSVTVPLTARVPRKNASRFRWKQLIRAFPGWKELAERFK
ncbi:MAG: hypothetical protein AABY07_01240 [Nanoarchaeota archaeon]